MGKSRRPSLVAGDNKVTKEKTIRGTIFRRFFESIFKLKMYQRYRRRVNEYIQEGCANQPLFGTGRVN